MEAEINFLRILSDPTRLKLLKLVLREELCVCELVEILRITQPAVSQHMVKLKLLGLVRERRAGLWTYYRADPAKVEAAMDRVVNLLYADIAEIQAMAPEWKRRQELKPRAPVCALKGSVAAL